jgi:SnoaL-like domain
VERSSELRDLAMRVYQAVTTSDISLMERMMSHRPDILNIGTDPDEWSVGFDTIMRIAQAQFQQMGGDTQSIQVEGVDPQAFVEGTVGWIADRGIYLLPGGIRFPFRMTMVAHQEGGEWRVVQLHVSVGVRNQDLLGQQLTAN